jgi:hypothetical protein
VASYGSKYSEPVVMLRGNGEPVLMNPTEIHSWLDDYDLVAIGLGYSVDDVDEDAQASGAVAVRRLGGPSRPDYYREV